MGIVDGSLVDFLVIVWSILKLLTALAHIHCMFGATLGSVLGATGIALNHLDVALS